MFYGAMMMMVGDSDGDDGGDGAKTPFLPYPQTIHKNLTQLRNGEILCFATHRADHSFLFILFFVFLR